MKSCVKLISYGVGAVLCAGLIAACDGRGVTPFESYQYSPAQIAKNKAARHEGQMPPFQPPRPGAPVNGGGTGAPGADSGKEAGSKAPPATVTPGGAADAGKIPGADEKSAADKSGKADQSQSKDPNEEKGDGEKAGARKNPPFSKILRPLPGDLPACNSAECKHNHNGPMNEYEVGQKMGMERSQLISFAENAFVEKEPRLADLVKGISVSTLASPDGAQMWLNLDAAVVVGGKSRLLHKMNSNVSVAHDPGKDTQDPKVVALLPEFKTNGVPDKDVAPDQFFLVAFCGDDGCSNIYILMEFKLAEKDTALAVFLFDPRAGKFMQHNLPNVPQTAQPPTFCEGVHGKDSEICKKQDTKGSTGEPATGAQTDPSAPAKPAAKAPEKDAQTEPASHTPSDPNASKDKIPDQGGGKAAVTPGSGSGSAPEAGKQPAPPAPEAKPESAAQQAPAAPTAPAQNEPTKGSRVIDMFSWGENSMVLKKGTNGEGANDKLAASQVPFFASNPPPSSLFEASDDATKRWAQEVVEGTANNNKSAVGTSIMSAEKPFNFSEAAEAAKATNSKPNLRRGTWSPSRPAAAGNRDQTEAVPSSR